MGYSHWMIDYISWIAKLNKCICYSWLYLMLNSIKERAKYILFIAVYLFASICPRIFFFHLPCPLSLIFLLHFSRFLNLLQYRSILETNVLEILSFDNHITQFEKKKWNDQSYFLFSLIISAGTSDYAAKKMKWKCMTLCTMFTGRYKYLLFPQ